VRAAFERVWRFAAVLANEDGLSGPAVRRRYRDLLTALARERASWGRLAGASDHFRKVTRSYWRGLFRCYEVADLPRTNNGLEQFFGSYRYHERRCSGRKVACPGTVVRGSVRLIAAAATRSRPVGAADLIPSDLGAWRELRRSLGRRQAVRALGRRFRRDPEAYLRSLEDTLINQALPV
jgi:hypothetical protein